jgi:hypothetical protein
MCIQPNERHKQLRPLPNTKLYTRHLPLHLCDAWFLKLRMWSEKTPSIRNAWGTVWVRLMCRVDSNQTSN